MMVPRFLFLWILVSEFGLVESSSAECGPPGNFIIAGSSTVFPLAVRWAERYEMHCPETKITVEGGGSSVGAGRLCDNPERGTAVDIGDMSREWKPSEADTDNGWFYECLTGDKDRSAIQIDVAIDGISITTKKGGIANDCIDTLGGLTIDQLRWIFSDYSSAQLVATGWDMEDAIPNSDGKEATHLWSELIDDPLCPPVEIKIAGADELSGTHDYFLETVFTDHKKGETFGNSRPNGYVNSKVDEDIVEYLDDNSEAVGYFGFAYYIANIEVLSVVPIKNPEIARYVEPKVSTVADGTYAPLSRRVFMNLFNNPDSLKYTRPFISFGLSLEGVDLVKQTGYVPIPDFEIIVMRSRAVIPGGTNLSSIDCGPSDGSITMAGSSSVKPIAELWSLIYDTACTIDHISIEGGGNAVGVGRICGNRNRGAPVDVGGMSRSFHITEATSKNGYDYQCRAPGDDLRSVIQIEVAVDAISVATSRRGVARECIDLMGGLTINQVRWIFSSYTEAELTRSGWDSKSIVGLEGAESNHMWSELDPRCASVKIQTAGSPPLSRTYDFFAERVLVGYDENEVFDETYFPEDNEGILVGYVLDNEAAIAYFEFSYFDQNRDVLASVPISRGDHPDDPYINPTLRTIKNGTYEVLSRRIYMNLLNNTESLRHTIPWMTFGLSDAGSTLVSHSGYVPLQLSDRIAMRQRLGIENSIAPINPEPPEHSPPENDETSSSGELESMFSPGVFCLSSLFLAVLLA